MGPFELRMSSTQGHLHYASWGARRQCPWVTSGPPKKGTTPALPLKPMLAKHSHQEGTRLPFLICVDLWNLWTQGLICAICDICGFLLFKLRVADKQEGYFQIFPLFL